MELELTRVDYLDVGVIVPNCMKLLPGEVAKHQQKVCGNFTFGLNTVLIKLFGAFR